MCDVSWGSMWNQILYFMGEGKTVLVGHSEHDAPPMRTREST